MNKIIIFPTDTVYGIGTHFLNQEGINKIYQIKGREFNKPLAILCKDIKDLNKYAKITKDAKKLSKAFHPGALTIILKSKKRYFKESNEKTISLRIPNHPKALELINQYGPLKTTSVNQSHEPPLNDYLKISTIYKTLVDEIYENKLPLSKISSTVIDISKRPYQIIREGEIKKEDMLKIINNKF
ncbi:MAG: L-threonylcarbamoyladenylate synthase [Acholeplasmataceae bacterium]